MLHVLSAVSPEYSLVLDPRRRMGGLGEKVGNPCDEFKNRGGMFG